MLISFPIETSIYLKIKPFNTNKDLQSFPNKITEKYLTLIKTNSDPHSYQKTTPQPFKRLRGSYKATSKDAMKLRKDRF